MKTEFEKYILSIGILTGVLHKRIRDIYDFYSELLTEEIQDIYVTDYRQEDGTNVYEDLWFFNDKYCMEAKQFVSSDNFDMEIIKKRILSWTINKSNYDFKDVTRESRLNVIFKLQENRERNLIGSRVNCDSLRDIFKKYIVPNLM